MQNATGTDATLSEKACGKRRMIDVVQHPPSPKRPCSDTRDDEKIAQNLQEQEYKSAVEEFVKDETWSIEGDIVALEDEPLRDADFEDLETIFADRQNDTELDAYDLEFLP